VEKAPPAPAPEQKGWFSIKVVDEVGDPIDGLDMVYVIAGKRQVVPTDGGGLARVDDVDLGTAAGRVADVKALREKLAPRWQEPRPAKIPKDEGAVIQELDGSLEELELRQKKQGLLVITPYFKCHEIPGTHFEFGRSFVRSSGLEDLARI